MCRPGGGGGGGRRVKQTKKLPKKIAKKKPTTTQKKNIRQEAGEGSGREDWIIIDYLYVQTGVLLKHKRYDVPSDRM